MESVTSLLKRAHLFKELTGEELQSIADIAIKRSYRERMTVFMRDDALDRVFFIYSGKVKIYRTDSTGKEQIISILQEGDMFPHTGFFYPGVYPANAEILEDTTLLVIPLKSFENLLLRYPHICIKLFRVMGERIIDLQNRLEEQVLHNTHEQVIMLLLRLCKAYGLQKEDGSIVLNSIFTHKDLANMIGSTRETINRMLSQLKKDKLLDVDAKGYFHVYVDRLREELSI